LKFIYFSSSLFDLVAFSDTYIQPILLPPILVLLPPILLPPILLPPNLLPPPPPPPPTLFLPSPALLPPLFSRLLPLPALCCWRFEDDKITSQCALSPNFYFIHMAIHLMVH
jgi:hypothetical protein